MKTKKEKKGMFWECYGPKPLDKKRPSLDGPFKLKLN
jgi:hypothetical protein